MTRIETMRIVVLITLVCIACPSQVLGIDRSILGEKTTASVYSLDGEKRELSIIDGHKRSLVVFWARQNKFSELELKALCDGKFRTKGIEIIAVNVDHMRPTTADKDSAKVYLKDIGCDFEPYFDPELKAFGELGVTAIPSTFLIDTSGSIVWTLAGYLVSSRQSLADQIIVRKVPPQSTWRSRINSKAIRYYQLARQLQKRGQWHIAETNARIAAGLDSTFPEPVVLLAELRLNEGRQTVTDSLLQKAFEIDSNCIPAMILTAKLGFFKNDTSITAHWIRKALAAEPGLPIAHAFSAWLAACENHRPQAEEFLISAETTGGHDSFVLYVCGRSRELLGDTDLAAKIYRKAMELLNFDNE